MNQSARARAAAQVDSSSTDVGYRELFEAHPHPMMVVDRASLHFMAVNAAAVAQYGYSREEFVALTARDIHPPADVTEAAKAIQRNGTGLDQAGIWRHRRKDGTVIEVEIVSHGITWDGRTAELVLALDVTDRLQVERALRELNETLEQRVAKRTAELTAALEQLEQFRASVSQGPAVIFRWRVADGWPVEFVTDNVSQFGYNAEQLISGQVGWTRITHPDDHQRLQAEVEGFLEAGRDEFTQEYRLIASDGQVRWIEDRNRVLRDDAGRITHVQGVVLDVTERKEAVEALRHSEARFRTIFEQANLGIALSGPNDLLIQTNPALQRMLGYRGDELHGTMGFADLTHPDDYAESRGLYDQLTHGRIDRYRVEKRYRRRDGGVVWAQVSVSAVRDQSGERPYVISMIEDITERREAEQALRISEQRFRAVFENSGLGVVLIDGEGRTVMVNPALRRLLGFGPDDQLAVAEGRADYEVVTHPDDLPMTREVYRSLSSGGSDRAQLEKRYLRRDGDVLWGRVTYSVMRDEQGALRYIVAIMEDITELKRAEELARRHEAERAHFARLISMGEMAAGLAHQLNQPLTAVVNYTQGCVRRLQAKTDDRESLIHAMNEAAGQAQRAGQIIQHLRRFIQKQEPARAPVDVNYLIRELVSMLAEVYARQRRIAIELDLADDLPPVSADAVQIEQVVLNLVNNGIEAISAAGTAKRVLSIVSRPHGPSEVEVTVSDSSGRAPEGDLEALFEPFFTTKEDGMGMGLKVSRSIVSAHGGRLWASINQDGGLTFHFVLPTRNA